MTPRKIIAIALAAIALAILAAGWTWDDSPTAAPTVTAT